MSVFVTFYIVIVYVAVTSHAVIRENTVAPEALVMVVAVVSAAVNSIYRINSVAIVAFYAFYGVC